jgi:hypothetical protein
MDIRKQKVYENCNIQHFKELLEREHGIAISYSALYNLMKEAGVESPKKHRHTVKHRRRKRKTRAGELEQIDATPYDWFSNGQQYALHGTIDDATGKITGLYMTENECLQGYFEVMKQVVLSFGVPLTMYSDKHTIFRSPVTSQKEEAGEEANLTQFGRAMDELGISIIHAHSPQAKGRIERVWETLQSRLPVEFALKGIKTMEEANNFLSQEYIPMFNERFAVAVEDRPIFIPYTHTEDLEDILCVKETRKTDSAGSFSFRGQRFKILDEGYPLIPARASIEVLVSLRNSIRVRYNGRVFNTVINTKTEAIPKPKRTKPRNVAPSVTPHLKHGSDAWKLVWHYEDYQDSLKFLYELFFKKSA